MTFLIYLSVVDGGYFELGETLNFRLTGMVLAEEARKSVSGMGENAVHAKYIELVSLFLVLFAITFYSYCCFLRGSCNFIRKFSAHVG